MLVDDGRQLGIKKRKYKIRKSLYMDESLLDEMDKICLEQRCTFNALAIYLIEKGVKDYGTTSRDS